MASTDSGLGEKLTPAEAQAAANILYLELADRPDDIDGNAEQLALLERAQAKLSAQGEAVDHDDPDDGTPTEAQGAAIAKLMRNFKAVSATVSTGPFGLPAGYVYLVVTSGSGGEYHAGIDRDGRASS